MYNHLFLTFIIHLLPHIMCHIEEARRLIDKHTLVRFCLCLCVSVGGVLSQVGAALAASKNDADFFYSRNYGAGLIKTMQVRMRVFMIVCAHVGAGASPQPKTSLFRFSRFFMISIDISMKDANTSALETC
jgi:hypothetical protein